MKAKICLYLLSALLVLIPSVSSAVTWKRESIHTGDDAGLVNATAIDRLGRVHVVYTSREISSGGEMENRIYYRLRSDSTSGFPPPSDEGAIRSNSVAEAYGVSIDVKDDLTVQIACVFTDGSVTVFERTRNETSFTQTGIASDATTNSSLGGVSIKSRGANNSAIIYTRRGETAADAGPVNFTEQSGSSWGTPVGISSGNGSGIAPVLINTPLGISGSNSTQRVVVAYDEANNNVHVVRQVEALIGGNPVFFWQSSEVVGESSVRSRPDIAYSKGKIAVTYREGFGLLKYAEWKLKAGEDGSGGVANYEWSGETLAEAEAISFRILGEKAPVVFDAGGNPLVSFVRDDADREMYRVETRRLVPGLTWVSGEVSPFRSYDSGQPLALSMATGLAGDPALIFPLNLSASTLVTFARPFSEPWIVEQPELLEENAQSFAPAVATSNDGSIYLATGGSMESGFINGRLITISGVQSSDRFFPVPNDGGFTNAHSITVTSDGMIHIVGMRVAAVDATQGEVYYWRGGATGAISRIGMVSDGDAAPGSLTLKSDGSGTLYVSYLRTDGRGVVQKLAPGESEWTIVVSTDSTAVVGLDLAVRADGGYALSYYQAASRKVSLLTNVDIRDGKKFPIPETLDVFSLNSMDREVIDTACVFEQDGRPRVAFVQGTTIKFSVPRGVGSQTFDTMDLGAGYDGATLEMLRSGRGLQILFHSERDEGRLHRLTFQNNGMESNTSFVNLKRPLDTAFSAQSISVAIDANGFPVVAVGLLKTFSLAGLEFQVILARPADALDDDGDGMSLLEEEAFCSNPNISDSNAERVLTDFFGSETISMIHSFDTPDLFFAGDSSAAENRILDIVYTIESSSDLETWDVEGSETEGVSYLSGNSGSTERPHCFRASFLRQNSAGYVNNNPKRFYRMTIRRNR